MIIKDAEYQYENSELLMLLNNKVPGLLELQIIISNGKLEYWYDITGTTSLGTMMELFSMDRTKLRRIIEDIYDMNYQLEDYMLDGENVSYLPEWIYYDRNDEKYKFCYLPGLKTQGGMGIQLLAEYLLTKIDHKDRDAVKMGYDFYEKSIQESCSAKELLGCIILPLSKEENESESGLIAETMQPISENADDWPIVDEDVSRGVKKGRMNRKTIKIKKKKVFSKSKDYEEILKELQGCQQVAEPIVRETPTVFLKTNKEVEYGKLIYQGSGKEENFVLEGDVFVIGKDTEKAQGILQADTVSRIHARIFRKEGSYYIEDLNSTNGTFVNGKELFYRDPVKLEKMDMICFATEEFLFG